VAENVSTLASKKWVTAQDLDAWLMMMIFACLSRFCVGNLVNNDEVITGMAIIAKAMDS